MATIRPHGGYQQKAKLSLYTPWRNIGEWRFIATHSLPRHCIEVIKSASRHSLLPHLLASGERSPGPHLKEAGWAPAPLDFWWRESYRDPVGFLTLDPPSRSLATLLCGLSPRLILRLQPCCKISCKVLPTLTSRSHVSSEQQVSCY